MDIKYILAMNWIKRKAQSGWQWMKRSIRKIVIGLFASSTTMIGSAFVIDNQIDPYIETSTNYKFDIQETLPDSNNSEVVILKNRPEVNFRKWGGAVNMGVYYDGLSEITKEVEIETNELVNVKSNPQGSRAFLTNRVEWKKGNEEVHAYPLASQEGMEDGGFEIEIVLNSKPTKNSFDFQISGWGDLDFFYQPPLTQQQVDDGYIRPENIVGSYAVYHKFLKDKKEGGTNYATGKAYHIFRPKIIDANESEIWGTLSYENGMLTVTVPQEFLDTATYPVKIDPTFGVTTLGASKGAAGKVADWSSDTSETVGETFTLSEAGLLSSIVVGIRTVSGTDVLDLFSALYREDSAAANSHDLVASSERLNVSVDGTTRWYGFSGASETLTADDYIIALIGNGEDLTDPNTDPGLVSDTASSVNYYNEATTGSGSYSTRKSEDPWGNTDSSSTDNYSMYVVYAPSAAGTDGWCDTSWSYRKQVFINSVNVDEDLTNFPLAIDITDTDLSSNASSTGKDIFFTEDDACATDDPGSFTKLDWELEKYASSTGAFTGWVEVPTVASSTETVLYMYYGKSATGDQTNATGVWDANYQAVWHLSEDPSTASTTDSTSNNADGQAKGSMTAGDKVAGQIGDSLDFDGSDDRVHFSAINISGGLTVSGWFNDNSSIGDTQEVIFENRDGWAAGEYGLYADSSNSILFQKYAANCNITSQPAEDTWHYLVGVHDGASAFEMFLNGASVHTCSEATSDGSETNAYIAGVGTDRSFGGKIDEVRISDTQRSAAWIKLEYYNQSGLFGIPAFGAQETAPAAAAALQPYLDVIFID